MQETPLYPVDNEVRVSRLLNGLWGFQFDPAGCGETENWQAGLPAPQSMPVPSSFSDLFTDKESRDYCGDFWYETDFYIPQSLNPQTDTPAQRIQLRFGSITHRGEIYLNGKKIGFHEGGFLPVVLDITDDVVYNSPNHLAVKINNELNETSIPCGNVKVCADGHKLAKPYFDFFNYSGLQRNVWLVFLPDEYIQDFETSYEIPEDGDNRTEAIVSYKVKTSGPHPVRVTLYDKDHSPVAYGEGKEGILQVENPSLWDVKNPYLYTLDLQIYDKDTLIDHYSQPIGIRTVEVQGKKILLNHKPVYLKGFGKHEDADILGRGFSWPLVKRDFECMKWTGANCFRTSHYPYAEEWYQMADQEGFLIIDEVPAVGMMRSTRNFVAAGQGVYTYFFEAPTVPLLQKAHIQDTEEMIARDKNHPSVIAWSLFNEPETITQAAYDYFEPVFNIARDLDPQHRPLTGAFEKNSKPELDLCHELCDFVCLNRYYGWYIKGSELEEAKEDFMIEMDKWKAKDLNKPFVFTEFGTDTLASEHKLPSIMWSQEYQDEYLNMNFEVFDSYNFIQGELVWNFADFQTTEGIMRVDGNKKGVFTRARQPKEAAKVLKTRWESLDEAGPEK